MERQMWICVKDYESSAKLPSLWLMESLKWSRKESIANAIKGSCYNWRQMKSFGWKCVKVKLILNTII